MIVQVATDGRMFTGPADLPKVDEPRGTGRLVAAGHRAVCPRCLWLGPVRLYTDPEHHDLRDTRQTAEIDYSEHRNPTAPECEPIALARLPLAGYALLVAMLDQVAPMLTAMSAGLDPNHVAAFDLALVAIRSAEILPAPPELDELDDDDDDDELDRCDRCGAGYLPSQMRGECAQGICTPLAGRF